MSVMHGLKRTPFTDAYPDGVTEWIDVFGYATPVTWGDPGAEYDAVRNRAAAMDFSMRIGRCRSGMRSSKRGAATACCLPAPPQS